jgi:hypothetical protein
LHSRAELDNLDGTVSTPIVVAVGLLLGVLVGATWTSRGAGQDQHLTRIPSRVRALHPWLLASVTSALSFIVVGVIDADPASGLVTVRSVLLWSGLALLSATLLGGTYCWVAPVVCFLALANSGYENGGAVRWWNVPALPSGSAGAWTIAMAVMIGASLLAFRWPART